MNRSLPVKLLPVLQNTAQKRGLIFGGIILLALLAFEVFNFSSTLFALSDILGTLSFGPVTWASILALAFCGIDFAGIARIFTPEQGRDEPAEVWYLFAAWFWRQHSCQPYLVGVSVAIFNTFPRACVARAGKHDQTGADLCGCHGAPDPCPVDQHLLHRRRAHLLDGRYASLTKSIQTHVSY